jgi:hypothetical protein
VEDAAADCSAANHAEVHLLHRTHSLPGNGAADNLILTAGWFCGAHPSNTSAVRISKSAATPFALKSGRVRLPGDGKRPPCGERKSRTTALSVGLATGKDVKDVGLATGWRCWSAPDKLEQQRFNQKTRLVVKLNP